MRQFSTLVLAILTASCSSTNVTRFSEKSFPARADNCELKIMNIPPKEAFVEIARLNTQGGPFGLGGRTLNAILPEMKKRACRLGADGIIVVQTEDAGQGGWYSKTNHAAASGIAIKFKGRKVSSY